MKFRDFSLGCVLIILVLLVISLVISLSTGYQTSANPNQGSGLEDSLPKDRSEDNRKNFGQSKNIDGATPFLPGSNFTVKEYLSGMLQETYNCTIQDLNSTHWAVECNYSRIEDWDEREVKYTWPFSATVSRTSVNHSYPAEDYYTWNGNSSNYFDYWQNTTGFYVGYVYNNQGVGMTVNASESITMAGLGTFNAWKITGQEEEIDFTYWYDQSNGMFLAMTFVYISTFWYNLTSYAFNQAPVGHIIAPLDTTADDEVTIRWNITDKPSYSISQDIYVYQDSSLVLTVATNIIGNGTHQFVTSFLSLPEGSGYYIVILVSDYFITTTLNSSNQPFTIEHALPPFVIVTSPINFRTYRSPITLTYDTNETIIAFYVNGINQSSIPISGQTFNLADGQHNFTVIARDGIGNKQKITIIFSVDNTPPEISIQGLANETYRINTLFVQINTNEISNITYALDNGTDTTIAAVTEVLITLADLEDGSHYLSVFVSDQVNNTQGTMIYFTIYTSSFDIYWLLSAETPRTLLVKDSSGTEWFRLTTASKIEQNFTLTVLPNDALTPAPDQVVCITKFQCASPNDIIFMTFAYPADDEHGYQWLFWANATTNWANITTTLNSVDETYEATYEGYIGIFALQMTSKPVSTSFVPAPSPSFELWVFTLAITLLYSIKRLIKNRRRS
ncbi:MAG: hypothetical protein ACFFC7_29245 [Candidatus Hermodarchaeota archaeon]